MVSKRCCVLTTVNSSHDEQLLHASMSEGYLEDDGTVECPLQRFCLKTGQALCLPATDPIQTFPVVLEDGALYVEMAGE